MDELEDDPLCIHSLPNILIPASTRFTFDQLEELLTISGGNLFLQTTAEDLLVLESIQRENPNRILSLSEFQGHPKGVISVAVEHGKIER